MTAHALVRSIGRRIGARSLWLLAVPGVLTALVILALAGAARDDVAIDARTGHATAEVLSVTSMRTMVEFAVPDGQVYRPTEGLAYPSGLQVRQLVRVEYDTADPELVRVAGRSWATGLLPAAIMLLAIWTLALPVGWWLRSHSTG
ncbi:MAG: DUF3592 domain-containing protein [Pseudonocardiaceae bacterium]